MINYQHYHAFSERQPAILYMTVDCMREQLLEGKKIRLGNLGDFSILLSSKGAEFKNLIADAEFNLNGKILNYQIQKKIDCLTTTNLLLTLII